MNFVVSAPFRRRRTAGAALGPEAWGAGRRLAVLLAPVAAGLVVGFDPGRAVWAWLGLAIVGLELAGHLARREPVPVSPRGTYRWRRQLRRRRIINRRRRIYAQRQQARAIRDARERRRSRRRMRRRRRIQARTFPREWGWAAAPESGPLADDLPVAPVAAVAELDLTGEVDAGSPVDIDLTGTAGAEPPIEIDLTDQAVFDSEITLESGDTLESGVVGPCPEFWPASNRRPHD